MEDSMILAKNFFKFGLIWEDFDTVDIEPFYTMFKREGSDNVWEDTVYFNNFDKYKDVAVVRRDNVEGKNIVSTTFNLDALPQRVKKIDIYIAFNYPYKSQITLGKLKNLKIVINEEMSNKDLYQYNIDDTKKGANNHTGYFIGVLIKNQSLTDEASSLWEFKPSMTPIIADYTIYDSLIRSTGLIII